MAKKAKKAAKITGGKGATKDPRKVNPPPAGTSKFEPTMIKVTKK